MIEFHLTGELFLNSSVRDALDEDIEVLGPAAFGTMLVVAALMLRSLWGVVSIVIMTVAVLLSALGFVGWTGLKLYGESGAALFVLMAVTVAHAGTHNRGGASGVASGNGSDAGGGPCRGDQHLARIPHVPHHLDRFPEPQLLGNAAVPRHGQHRGVRLHVRLRLCGDAAARLSLADAHAAPTRRGGEIEFHGRVRAVRGGSSLASSSGLSPSLVVVLVGGILRIELNENHHELLDKSYEYRQSSDFISREFGGLEPFEYSLSAGKAGGITNAEFLRNVDAFAAWLRAQPEVVHVYSLADVIKRLNSNLNADKQEFYKIPDNSDLAAQYLLLYEFSLPVGLDLNNLIDVERSTTRLTAMLGSLTVDEKIGFDDRAQAWLRKNAPGMETGASGVTIVGAYSVMRNIQNMLIGTVIAMGIVSFLLIFVFRSLRFGLISLIPNFVPAAMAMGLWGYAVKEVGVAASVVTALAFGIIVDDTIHFMTKYLRGRKQGLLPSESVQLAFGTAGKALLATTVVFALGFLVFGASGIASNQSLGPAVGHDGHHRPGGGLHVAAAVADGAGQNQGNHRRDQGAAAARRQIGP